MVTYIVILFMLTLPLTALTTSRTMGWNYLGTLLINVVSAYIGYLVWVIWIDIPTVYATLLTVCCINVYYQHFLTNNTTAY